MVESCCWKCFSTSCLLFLGSELLQLLLLETLLDCRLLWALQTAVCTVNEAVESSWNSKACYAAKLFCNYPGLLRKDAAVQCAAPQKPFPL